MKLRSSNIINLNTYPFYNQGIIICIFCIYVVIGAASKLSAQKGFSGTFVTGLTASQIDGDRLVGYNKLGITAGMKLGYELSSRFEGNMEILYTQRGSRSQTFGSGPEVEITMADYFELPIYLTLRDWYIKEGSYHKISVHGGFSYANLLNASSNSELYNADLFKKSDISWLIGVNYAFTRNWRMTVRYSRSISKLLEDEALPINYLLNYFWTVRAEYNF